MLMGGRELLMELLMGGRELLNRAKFRPQPIPNLTGGTVLQAVWAADRPVTIFLRTPKKLFFSDSNFFIYSVSINGRKTDMFYVLTNINIKQINQF